MYKCFAILLLLLASCSNRIYIVRHAEKQAVTTQMMSADVALSKEGEERALALKQTLADENIRHVYSTNYIRTRNTVKPLADAKNLQVMLYDARDSLFAAKLRSHKKGNVLVAGHSNTVDDLINQVMGRHILNDLPDSAYGDLFVLKRKGKKYSYERKHFGK